MNESLLDTKLVEKYLGPGDSVDGISIYQYKGPAIPDAEFQVTIVDATGTTFFSKPFDIPHEQQLVQVEGFGLECCEDLSKYQLQAWTAPSTPNAK